VDTACDGAVAEEAGREGYLEEEGGARGADVEDVSGGKKINIFTGRAVNGKNLPAVCD
jgi:hypothetical protein